MSLIANAMGMALGQSISDMGGMMMSFAQEQERLRRVKEEREEELRRGIALEGERSRLRIGERVAEHEAAATAKKKEVDDRQAAILGARGMRPGMTQDDFHTEKVDGGDAGENVRREPDVAGFRGYEKEVARSRVEALIPGSVDNLEKADSARQAKELFLLGGEENNNKAYRLLGKIPELAEAKIQSLTAQAILAEAKALKAKATDKDKVGAEEARLNLIRKVAKEKNINEQDAAEELHSLGVIRPDGTTGRDLAADIKTIDSKLKDAENDLDKHQADKAKAIGRRAKAEFDELIVKKEREISDLNAKRNSLAAGRRSGVGGNGGGSLSGFWKK